MHEFVIELDKTRYLLATKVFDSLFDSGENAGPNKGPCTSETAAPRWLAPLATPCNPPPAIRRRFFFGRCIMPDALKRAEHYRDLAKRYLRVAALTENPNHYLRIAVQYNGLAEAEEVSTSLVPRPSPAPIVR
jgi:hypothetical protein